jgi:hypothetical protein
MSRSIKLLFVFGFLSLFLLPLDAQDAPPSTAEQMDSIYLKNILKSRINGVYIPKDIDDAFEEFIHLSPEASLEKFKLAPEEKVAQKLHFGIGRWMIVNWNFYEGSRLSHHLRNLGLLHPDDMADLLIVVFHRKLNEKDLGLAQLVDDLVTERHKKMKALQNKDLD